MTEYKKNETSEQKSEIWFSALAADDSYFDTDAAKQRFLASIGKRKRHFPKGIATVAAAVISILVVGLLSFHFGKESLNDKLSEVSIEAPYGSITKMDLPDGSKIWLHSGTKISYPQDFGVKTRMLSLEGEAYFEIAKNQDLPFTVQTKELKVTVLGTKFNIHDYSDEDHAIVDLIEGKISLENCLRDEDAICLSPNQRALQSKKTGRISVMNISTSKSSDWINNKLFFDEVPLPDVVKELERAYDVKIEITNDKLLDLKIFGSFDTREQSIRDIFDIMTATGHIKYTETNENSFSLTCQ